MPRVDRERLIASGFLQKVMKGWYIPARPDEVRERGKYGLVYFILALLCHLSPSALRHGVVPVTRTILVPAWRQLVCA